MILSAFDTCETVIKNFYIQYPKIKYKVILIIIQFIKLFLIIISEDVSIFLSFISKL